MTLKLKLICGWIVLKSEETCIGHGLCGGHICTMCTLRCGSTDYPDFSRLGQSLRNNSQISALTKKKRNACDDKYMCTKGFQ